MSLKLKFNLHLKKCLENNKDLIYIELNILKLNRDLHWIKCLKIKTSFALN